MTPPSQNAITDQSQAGVRRNAPTIASGVAAASVVPSSVARIVSRFLGKPPLRPRPPA